MLNLKDSEEATQALTAALALPGEEGYWQVLRIKSYMGVEIAAENRGTGLFGVSAELRAFFAFMQAWGWYARFPIDYADAREIIARGLALVPTVMAQPEMWEELPSVRAFLSDARAQFESLKLTPKYRSGGPGDPMGG